MAAERTRTTDKAAPSSDPRYAHTLGEACSNGDGTFNGVRALSWLSEVLNPGRGVPVERVEEIAREVVERRR